MDACASIELGSVQIKKMMQPSLTNDALLVAFSAKRDYREKFVALIVVLQKEPEVSSSTVGILEELVDLSQSIQRGCHERVSSCI